MKTDIQIAQECQLRHITEIAATAGVDEKYIEQVNDYMELLKSIGYTDVRGYLWYVYKNYIKEI